MIDGRRTGRDPESEFLRRLVQNVERLGPCHGIHETCQQDIIKSPQRLVSEFADRRSIVLALAAATPSDKSLAVVGMANFVVLSSLAQYFGSIHVFEPDPLRAQLVRASLGSLGLQHVDIVHGEDATQVPYLANTVDVCLVDIASCVRAGAKCDVILRELNRVLSPGGRCIVVVRRSEMRRRSLGRLLRRYTLADTSLRITRALEACGLHAFCWLHADPSVKSLNRLRRIIHHRPSRRIPRQGTAESSILGRIHDTSHAGDDFAILARKPTTTVGTSSRATCPSFLDGIVSDVQQELASRASSAHRLDITRLEVRRSGRIVLFATDHERRIPDYVIRVPTDPSTLVRDRTNMDAIMTLRSEPALATSLSQYIPRPVMQGEHFGQKYFVEEYIRGTERGAVGGVALRWHQRVLHQRRTRASGRLYRKVGDFCLHLGSSTVHPAPSHETESTRILDMVNAIGPLLRAPERRLMSKATDFLANALLDSKMRRVWAHGDIGCNYLETHDGNLAGVIDWETFDRDGLPFQDWILLSLFYTHERRARGWDLLPRIVRDGVAEIFSGLPISAYENATGTSVTHVPLIAVHTWLRYVASRLPERQFDPLWVRRVIPPGLTAITLLMDNA